MRLTDVDLTIHDDGGTSTLLSDETWGFLKHIENARPLPGRVPGKISTTDALLLRIIDVLEQIQDLLIAGEDDDAKDHDLA